MAEYGINSTTLNIEHLQLKFKNAADWADTDVLLAGELGVELDTHKAKIGDGATAWKDLGYSADPTVQGLVDQLTSKMTAAEGNITSLQGRMDTAESSITAHGTRLDGVDGDISGLKDKDTAHEGRLDALEGITTISANSFRESD